MTFAWLCKWIHQFNRIMPKDFFSINTTFFSKVSINPGWPTQTLFSQFLSLVLFSLLYYPSLTKHSPYLLCQTSDWISPSSASKKHLRKQDGPLWCGQSSRDGGGCQWDLAKVSKYGSVISNTCMYAWHLKRSPPIVTRANSGCLKYTMEACDDEHPIHPSPHTL